MHIVIAASGRVSVKGSVHRAQDALAKDPLIVIEAQTGGAANSLKRIRRMRNQELPGERQTIKTNS